MHEESPACNSFSYSSHPRKDGTEAEYAKGYWIRHAVSLSEFSRTLLTNAWVAGVFRDGIKRNANFMYADLLGFDFDSPKFTLDDALKYFAPYAHVIGTTKSHQKEKAGAAPCDRFRVAVQWESRVTDPLTYAWNAKRLGEPLFADPMGFRASQYMKPCAKIISIQEVGLRFGVFPPPPKPVYAPSPYQGSRQIPPEVSASLAFGVPNTCRHEVILKSATKLALCGFTLSETVDLIMNSALKGSKDAERTARDGWEYGASKNSHHQATKGDSL